MDAWWAGTTERESAFNSLYLRDLLDRVMLGRARLVAWFRATDRFRECASVKQLDCGGRCGSYSILKKDWPRSARLRGPRFKCQSFVALTNVSNEVGSVLTFPLVLKFPDSILAVLVPWNAGWEVSSRMALEMIDIALTRLFISRKSCSARVRSCKFSPK